MLKTKDKKENLSETEVNNLPEELVSQEYLDGFNLNDYKRVSAGFSRLGITLVEDYYGNIADYVIVSEPTRIISDTTKVTKNTYWQIGDNENFILNLVDEDWGNYERAYYVNKNYVFPNKDDKIVKSMVELDKEIKFSKEQLNYIENLVKTFDKDLVTKPENEFLNGEEYLNDYPLIFCFEGFDDVYLTCCNIAKDKSGQWYLFDYYYHDTNDKIVFIDLEELPQDICDAINESFN